MHALKHFFLQFANGTKTVRMHALDTLFSSNSKLFQILSECTIYCPWFYFCTTVPNCFKYCQNACIRYIVFMDFNAYFVFLAISITILIYTLGQTRSMPQYATDLNTFKWRLYMYKYIGLYVIILFWIQYGQFSISVDFFIEFSLL